MVYLKVPFYAFEEQIQAVSNLVKDYMKNIQLSFEQKFSEYTTHTFLQSVFSFGDASDDVNTKNDRVKRQFYLSRVATTHIRYLDDFRCFLLNSQEFMQFVNNKRSNYKLLKNMAEINCFLLDAIENYVFIIKSGLFDPSLTGILQNLENNIIIARNNGIDWDSINRDL